MFQKRRHVVHLDRFDKAGADLLFQIISRRHENASTVIASNVACPSLSPDGRQIAFKRQLPGTVVRWRLSVLDLATLKVHPLAETRSVDDQIEWLNDTTVIYGVLQNKAIAALNPFSATTPSLTNGATLVTNMWTVPADGTGTPHLFTAGAWSEVVTNR